MRYSVIIVLILSVATCGQKGPLYLPEPQADGKPEQSFVRHGDNFRSTPRENLGYN